MDEKPCAKVIAAADKVIAAQKVEIDLSKLAIAQAKDANAQLLEQRDSARKDAEAWYRNPFVMLALGIAAGAVATAVIVK